MEVQLRFKTSSRVVRFKLVPDSWRWYNQVLQLCGVDIVHSTPSSASCETSEFRQLAVLYFDLSTTLIYILLQRLQILLKFNIAFSTCQNFVPELIAGHRKLGDGGPCILSWWYTLSIVEILNF